MRKLGIFLPLLAGFAATPALAQDVGVSFRAEARAGYDEVRADLRVQNSVFADDFGVSDVMYGAEAGVDARLSRILVGAYVGADFSQVEGCVVNPFAVRTTNRQDIVCVDAGRNVYAGGRLGLSIDGGDMPMGEGGRIYVKGGLSRGKFAAGYVVEQAAAGQRTGEIFSGRDTVSGYHAGGGFELDVTPNIYVKGEYVQHRYDNAFTSLLNTDMTNPNPLSRTDRFDPKRHQLVFGVGFRFGGR